MAEATGSKARSGGSAAARREAQGKGHTYKTRSGKTYEVPPTGVWPLRLTEYLNTGRVELVVRALCGEDALDDFTNADADDFLTQIMRDEGLGDSGNS